ncbi:MAG TPA: hypothetical protein VEJ18_02755, partial [Planctomycetota bacterium]|nr:hypothetical protein [Planctomycetota bacterium]
QPQAVVFILLVGIAIALSGVGLAFASPVHAALILVQIAALLAVLILAERVGARVVEARRRREAPRSAAEQPEELRAPE